MKSINIEISDADPHQFHADPAPAISPCADPDLDADPAPGYLQLYLTKCQWTQIIKPIFCCP